MQAAYTYSKSLTNSLVNTANSNNSNDTRQQYGPSYFNHPQRFIINYSWDLPFGTHQGFAGKVINGWNLSGVTTIQGGAPMTIIDSRGGSVYGTGTGTATQGGFSRAQLCPGVTYGDLVNPGGVKANLGGYFNKSSFCAPPVIPNTGGLTDFGNSGAGIVLGPGQFNFDVTLIKNTQIAEGQNLQFRAEFFNLFNHTQFNQPNFANPSLPNVNNPAFGLITSTSVNPRVMQLALKYSF
jgi:hypothetical protein